MKVGIVSLSYFIPKKASTETYLELIAKAFKKDKVHVFALSDRNMTTIGKHGEKIHLIRASTKLSFFNPFVDVIKLFTEICKERVDFLFTGEIQVTGLAASIYSMLTRAKTVITVTGNYDEEMKVMYKDRSFYGTWIEKLLLTRFRLMEFLTLRMADFFIADGPSMSYVLSKKGVPTTKTMMSYGATEVDEFKPDEKLRRKKRQKLGYTKHTVITYIGNLLERDGIMTALGCFKQLRNPELRLLILGDGEQMSLAKEFVDKNKLKVHFAGWVPHEQVKGYFAASDIVIFPMVPPQVGLSMAAIEAMAMELPVITTDVGGMTDLVLDYETGLVVKPTIDAFANGIKELLEFGAHMRAELGKKARKHVLKNFTCERMSKDFHKVVEKLK